MDCSHKNKIVERLFTKFGKPIAVLICCLECGNQIKIKEKLSFCKPFNFNFEFDGASVYKV